MCKSPSEIVSKRQRFFEILIKDTPKFNKRISLQEFNLNLNFLQRSVFSLKLTAPPQKWLGDL